MEELIPSWRGKSALSQKGMCHYIWDACNANSKGYDGGEGDWLVQSESDVLEYLEKTATLARGFGFGAMESHVVAFRLQHWRRSRRNLHFSNINAAFDALVHESPPDRSVVSSWIFDQVATGRCLYRGLDDWLIPLFVVADYRLLVLFDGENRRFLHAPMTIAESRIRLGALKPCPTDIVADLASAEGAHDQAYARKIMAFAVQKFNSFCSG